jgi:hypothetical protein
VVDDDNASVESFNACFPMNNIRSKPGNPSLVLSESSLSNASGRIRCELS